MANKTVDLNFSIKDLEGKDIDNAGKLIANHLMIERAASDPVKFFNWANAFYSGQIVDMDSSDFEKFKTFVKNDGNLYVIAKAPILEYLNTL